MKGFVVLGCFSLAIIAGREARAQAESARGDVSATVEHVEKVVSAGPFQASWKSLEEYKIPEWYQNAKFGIFIHWGVYSVPAYGSEWYPRNMYMPGSDVFKHHVVTFGSQKDFGYKDFISKFDAQKFDPAAWAALFKEAGARYVVPVAEHHDGFPMYDCSYTRWDASEMGPKRDVIGELAQAVRLEGMKFGVSSHRAFNWAYYARAENFDTVDPANFELYGQPNDFLFTDKPLGDKWPPQSERFMNNWLARTSEVVDRYHPDLVWFDFGITPDRALTYDTNPNADYLRRFAAFYYNQAAARGQVPVINYKFNAFPDKAAVLDLERSKMDCTRELFWQTDTAVSSSSWGYTQNQQYKPVNRLVDDLVDIVAKNGCLLLNIGPRPDGTIPEPDQEILREIGRWLAINGEAIYDSRPWKTYGEGPTGTVTGHLSESKNAPYTSEDIRFTTREDKLYATALAWPEDGVLKVKTLGTKNEYQPGQVTGVKLLGHEGVIKFEQTEQALAIRLPDQKPCDHAFVLEIQTR